MIKPLISSLEEVADRIRGAGHVMIMLDFDGTLSDIAPNPDSAVISEKAKAILPLLARRYKAAIISGRALADIKNKVGVDGLIYAGNHGLEWQEGDKKIERAKIDEKKLKLIERLKPGIREIVGRYPGAVFEDKEISAAAHFREVEDSLKPQFCKDIESLISSLPKSAGLRIDKDNMAYDFRAGLNWNKGDLVKALARKYLPGSKGLIIYAGDALTDEDAFRAVEDGVTIRVGEDGDSKAKYFVEKRSDIDVFLEFLANLSGDGKSSK